MDTTLSQIAVLGSMLLGFATAGAQTPEAAGSSNGPFALVNARVVVSPEEVIERATIFIRDGRIQDVGSGRPVPSDAFVLDLEGRSVYPGLIDPAATVASTQFRRTSGNAGHGLEPGRTLPDSVELTDALRGAWRGIGVTTLGLAHAGGTDAERAPGPQYRIQQEDHPLLPGRVSVVSLGSDPLAESVLSPGVAVQVGFGTRKVHAYPVTLMGSIAFLHQAFLDAGYQSMARSLGADVSGGESFFRPEVLPLEAAATGKESVWFTVWQENNIRRAIALATELELDFTLLGAQEAWRVIDEVVAAGRPVLVSLDYPAARATTGRNFDLDAFGAGGVPLPAEQVDREIAERLRSNPSRLVEAGVKVALTSYGLEDPQIFWDRVIEAVEAGLPRAEALRSLTTVPASLLGLEDSLGTIEEGKLANLVIVSGDLFSRSAIIERVFVGGHQFVLP